MRRNLLWCLPMFALLAVAPRARADAWTPWRACLQHAIKRIDDGTSDARAIAAAAVEACRPTRAAILRTRIRAAGLGYDRPGEIAQVLDGERQRDVDFASVVVLGLRHGRNQAPRFK